MNLQNNKLGQCKSQTAISSAFWSELFQKTIWIKMFYPIFFSGRNKCLSKIILSKNIWSPKKFWVQKNFESKKIVGPKKFESKKYFESKFFGPPPPYSIGLSMVGWIGRGGLGWGFHFLALEKHTYQILAAYRA